MALVCIYDCVLVCTDLVYCLILYLFAMLYCGFYTVLMWTAAVCSLLPKLNFASVGELSISYLILSYLNLKGGGACKFDIIPPIIKRKFEGYSNSEQNLKQTSNPGYQLYNCVKIFSLKLFVHLLLSNCE